MTQKQAAEVIGVDEFTLLGWEKNRHEPAISAYKNIVDFLGFHPDTTGLKQRTFGERLIFVRRSLGLTQANAAQLIGIDPSTLSRYERNVKIPEPELIHRLKEYLHDATPLKRK